MTKNTLKDYVRMGSQGDRKKGIDKVIYKCRHIKRWYEKNKERTEKSVILLNLLDSVADYLEVANDSFGKHISILAMATRNQYELSLRITSLIQDEKEIDKWQSESITDGIQACEGFLNISEKSTPETASIQDEIDSLVRLRKKWGLPVVKNSMGSGNLAGKVGMQEEHLAFFKLYSKLVHPSSLVVNKKDYCTDLFFPILEMNLQTNALSSINMVCEALQIPSKVSKQYGPQIDGS